jgi:putative ATPase
MAIRGRRALVEIPDLPVPLPIRNAPTGLMKKMDYGKGYQYGK